MQSLLRHSIVALILLLLVCSQRASAQVMTTALSDQMHLPALIERTDAAKPRPAAPRPMRRLAALRLQTEWDASFVRGRGGEPNPVTFELNRIPRVRTIKNERRSNGMSNRQIDLHVLQQDVATREGGVKPWEQRLAIAQGSYYVITGLWPILHMQSFEKVTGPKTDDWLVKTVGAMITVVGGTLLISGLDDGPSNDMKLVAAGSAAALAAVDVTYVAKGRISRIYLLDAVAELALIIGWGLTMR